MLYIANTRLSCSFYPSRGSSLQGLTIVAPDHMPQDKKRRHHCAAKPGRSGTVPSGKNCLQCRLYSPCANGCGLFVLRRGDTCPSCIAGTSSLLISKSMDWWLYGLHSWEGRRTCKLCWRGCLKKAKNKKNWNRMIVSFRTIVQVVTAQLTVEYTLAA